MPLLKKIWEWMAARYDRLLALVIFLALAGSLVYLAIRIGMIRMLDEQYTSRLDALTPRYPAAETVSAADYERAMNLVRNPVQLAMWTNSLTIPELRIWCIDCKRPIGFDDMVCDFCGAKQPREDEVVRVDTDGDGIPDVVEEQYKLDPRDPKDALEDSDGDKFDNLHEYRVGTNLRDRMDHPPIEPYIAISKIDAIPFNFLFKSYMRGRGDRITFQLNTRDQGQTYFVKLGAEVEGFTVTNFTRNVLQGEGQGSPRQDRSELTLQKGEKTIILVRGEDVQYDEYTVHFRFRLDGTEYPCKLGDRFQCRPKHAYELIHIDSARKTVVLQRLIDGKEFTISGSSVRGG